MLTNYFTLTVKEAKPFYQYHVSFSPPVSNSMTIRHISACVLKAQAVMLCFIFVLFAVLTQLIIQMDNVKLRKALVHNIESLKNRHLFDGMLICYSRSLRRQLIFESIFKNTVCQKTIIIKQRLLICKHALIFLTLLQGIFCTLLCIFLVRTLSLMQLQDETNMSGSD